jgi:phage shock protein E
LVEMRWWVAAIVLVIGLGAGIILWMRAASTEAHDMIAQGGVLLDVRSPEEFAAGHLPGAVNIPVGEVRARVAELGPRSRPVVTYCRSGGRSARAAATLRELGFEKVLNLGPKAAW